MPFTNNAKDGMLGPVRGRITDLSIHTGDPSTTGANEVSGGGYARVAVTTSDFTSPSAGAFTLNNDKDFVAGAATNALFFGAWDDTTFLGGGAITGDTAFNAEGDFILKSGTSFDLNG